MAHITYKGCFAHDDIMCYVLQNLLADFITEKRWEMLGWVEVELLLPTKTCIAHAESYSAIVLACTLLAGSI